MVVQVVSKTCLPACVYLCLSACLLLPACVCLCVPVPVPACACQHLPAAACLCVPVPVRACLSWKHTEPMPWIPPKQNLIYLISLRGKWECNTLYLNKLVGSIPEDPIMPIVMWKFYLIMHNCIFLFSSALFFLYYPQTRKTEGNHWFVNICNIKVTFQKINDKSKRKACYGADGLLWCK